MELRLRPRLAALDQCARFIELAAVLSCEHEVVARVLAACLHHVRLRGIDDRDDAAELGEGVQGYGQRVAHPINSRTLSTP